MTGNKPPREDRRIIAIQVSPKAYDEIQRLKGKTTWTKFIIECVLAKVGSNDLLQVELTDVMAAIETRRVKSENKAKAEKVKAEKKAKAEKPAEPKATPTEPKATPTKPPKVKVTAEGTEPTAAELKAIETEQPTSGRDSTAGISTPAMRQKGKGKTLQQLQAAKTNK